MFQSLLWYCTDNQNWPYLTNWGLFCSKRVITFTFGEGFVLEREQRENICLLCLCSGNPQLALLLGLAPGQEAEICTGGIKRKNKLCITCWLCAMLNKAFSKLSFVCIILIRNIVISNRDSASYRHQPLQSEDFDSRLKYWTLHQRMYLTWKGKHTVFVSVQKH